MDRPRSSHELLAHAIEIYVAAFDRLRRRYSADPDVGSGPTFVSGLRSLQARHLAAPFAVPEEKVRKYRLIVGEPDEMADSDEQMAWLEAFPRRTLALLDRRGHGLAGRRAGRRWIDRIVARSRQPRPEAGVTSRGIAVS